MLNSSYRLRSLALIYLFMGLTLVGCAHNIDFRSSHFAVPMVSPKQWGGHVELIIGGATNVELIQDINTNPPLRDKVKINDSLSLADAFGLNTLSLDAGLTVYTGTEIFISGSKYGVRYQFLNFASNENTWVAAVMGSAGGFSSETSSTISNSKSTATTEVSSTQAGISLGYQLTEVVPYLSYIHELHEAKTTVSNQHGRFGAYKDSGNHDTVSVGICSKDSLFSWAIEVNSVQADWKRSTAQRNTTYGLRLGYAW